MYGKMKQAELAPLYPTRGKRPTETALEVSWLELGLCISPEGRRTGLSAAPAQRQCCQVLAHGQCLEKGALSAAQSRAQLAKGNKQKLSKSSQGLSFSLKEQERHFLEMKQLLNPPFRSCLPLPFSFPLPSAAGLQEKTNSPSSCSHSACSWGAAAGSTHWGTTCCTLPTSSNTGLTLWFPSLFSSTAHGVLAGRP